jgi:hypothetical protein
MSALDKEGRKRCAAKISWGSTWEAGRRQCFQNAKPDEDYCGIHLAQAKRREARALSHQGKDEDK